MDYKETLLLPKTDFPMRGDLPNKEPAHYATWFRNNTAYKTMIQNRANATRAFNLHDGPPYANGHIHIGHALNKILKDVIVKTHYFFGESVRYVPGWDCHGLPIEQQVEKALGKEKKETLPKTKIRQLCREHAQKFVDIQSQEFQSLGIIGDWENPYLTMKYAFEADIYRALCEVVKQGLLVERSKPVYWSWAAKSALAEAEVEYEQKEDYSIFVAFEGSPEVCEKLGIEGPLSFVIWTTTPWTLPANVAIALSPTEPYVVTSEGYVVAKALVAQLSELGITQGEIQKEFKGEEVENLFATNPLNGRSSRLILGEHVMVDGGSGLVHTAPGHGEEDYRVGLKYGLEVVMPVDEEGKYDESIVHQKLLPAHFVGEHVFRANEQILELLGAKLLHCSKFKHSYPFCWRTHKPVIYRATRQWFIAMDEAKIEGETLRNLASREVENTRFYPQSGKKRLGTMIENRPDWCISRQRDWGVPIAFFRDKTTGEVVLDGTILEHIGALFEKEGADVWWDKPIAQLLPSACTLDPQNLEKVMDILDVWFDSGSTWKAVLESSSYDAGEYPASMYLEGSDQHRGWFQSSLLVSTAARGKAPYGKILTHGFTVDEKGEKMSKSKGNVVAPEDIAKQNGVEILRLWVGMSDYATDLKISPTIIKQVSEQYRKIRNTLRFMLSCVYDVQEVVAPSQMSELDRWILGEAGEVLRGMEVAFREYDFSKGYALLTHFMTVELSGIYLDVTKDRLYCNGKEDRLRRSAQSAIVHMTRAFLPLLAPVLTYTVDEVLQYAPPIIKQEAKSVFDLVYAPIEAFTCKLEGAQEVREKFFEIVDSLKKEKRIKSTLELVVETKAPLFYEVLREEDAQDWLTVSGISPRALETEMLGKFEANGTSFVLWRSEKAKCPRCWKYAAEDENTPCPRCAQVLTHA
ncbi:isoleucine--tRNA ligase [Sulfurospirillum sp. T05]|uniref:Isoleucine--tRNA ligase n=1 Tax=Sulfurospirillum tamanense TaxID=2813362 RepID=A0ABS2WUI2_9BACT|nr:isoleucine--tRNA ligase [Sulfurospirillum tamanensis]MBN2965314.1 isoleucine--tRNA ligase [Sulfurospirillum tamanensis]